MTAKIYVEKINDLFLKHVNVKNSVPMSAYMKNHFEFYGIRATERRHLQRSFLKKFSLPGTDTLDKVVKGLWALPNRELQYFGMEITEKLIRKVDQSFIEVIEFMIINKSWWDTVDYIAVNSAGKFLMNYSKLIPSRIEKWANSNNMWLNRSSILYQLKYKSQTDTDLLSRNILRHKNSKEFFLQKAIGWSLREYSKSNPQWVRSFVGSHQLAPLSVREALKRIL